MSDNKLVTTIMDVAVLIFSSKPSQLLRYYIFQ